MDKDFQGACHFWNKESQIIFTGPTHWYSLVTSSPLHRYRLYAEVLILLCTFSHPVHTHWHDQTPLLIVPILLFLATFSSINFGNVSIYLLSFISLSPTPALSRRSWGCIIWLWVILKTERIRYQHCQVNRRSFVIISVTLEIHYFIASNAQENLADISDAISSWYTLIPLRLPVINWRFTSHTQEMFTGTDIQTALFLSNAIIR